MPTQADWLSAQFEGFIHSGPTGDWNTIPAGTHDEDTIYVFKTFVMAEQDTILPLQFDGDDGHSIYLNDNFFFGGGFGARIDFDLALTAFVPVEIEIGVYNGPGPMGVYLFRRDSYESIDTTPFVHISANGFSSATVPEPSSFWLLTGFVALLTSTVRPRIASKESEPWR